MLFNKRLRYMRMEKEITQQRMADMLDISLNAYQKYEQAERSPSLETLIKIADILDVSIDYLLCRDEWLKVRGVFVDERQ